MTVNVGLAEYLDRIGPRARRERQPLHAIFEITPTCNLRCHFCYVALDPYRGPYLSTSEAIAILDKLAEGGVLTLTLTGGEIFSRRDFGAIYEHAMASGFLVTLYTNATLITERIAAHLATLPPHEVEVSIYGADREHYEGVTGIPGSFERFERGVARLQAGGINPLMKHLVTTLTEDHVDAVREWCQARRLRHRFNTVVENRHDGGLQPSLYRIQPKHVREVNGSLERARTLRAVDLPLPECSERDEDRTDRLYQCGAGRATVFVDGLGQASHCVLDRQPAFPLLTMSWKEVWSRIGEWVDQPLPPEAPCSGCGLRGHCSNCPARARAVTGSPYDRDPYHCDSTHLAFDLAPIAHDTCKEPRPVGACTM